MGEMLRPEDEAADLLPRRNALTGRLFGPFKEIQQRSAGLVVLGSHGRRGPAALASLSERMAHRATCSVLVLRGCG